MRRPFQFSFDMKSGKSTESISERKDFDTKTIEL